MILNHVLNGIGVVTTPKERCYLLGIFIRDSKTYLVFNWIFLIHENRRENLYILFN